MTTTKHRRPVDAALRALREEGRVCAELRRRLERMGEKRFHLHRTLMRLRYALDSAPGLGEFYFRADEILTEAGYPSQERERVA